MRLALAPPLLALAPMLAFLRHHGVPLSAPEAISFLLLGVAIGAALGGLGAVLGRSALAIVAAALVIASVDAQSDYFAAWDAKLAWHFALLAALAVLLRGFLARALPAIAAAVLLAAALGPSAPDRVRIEREVGAVDASLPLVLHIVLDEHLGIEGIPRSFDPDAALANELIAFYRDWGFVLHGRAYSRYVDTHDAIPNLLNFEATRRRDAQFDGRFERGASLGANAYFEEMRRRGHDIHVYQTDYLDLCRGPAANDVAHCFEYVLESPNRLRELAMSDSDKTRMLTAMYMRLSVVWSRARNRYRDLRLAIGSDAWPDYDTARGRMSSVSGMLALDVLRNDLRAPEPGGFYFAHIALPHYPYSYDARCQLRSAASSWLNAGLDGAKGAAYNTQASRDERYRRYLEQLRCTTRKLGELFSQLRQSGHYDTAHILVHGDHGSRITIQKMRFDNRERTASRPAQDYVDSFSTLFAIKQAGVQPGYARGVLPIDILFDAYLRAGRAPSAAAASAWPEVLLRGSGPDLVPTPLPEFAHGRVSAPSSEPRPEAETGPDAETEPVSR